MTFKAKKPDLQGRVYRNIDEIIRVRTARRSHLLQAESCLKREVELVGENEKLEYLLRPASQEDVTFDEFVAQLRGSDSKYHRAA